MIPNRLLNVSINYTLLLNFDVTYYYSTAWAWDVIALKRNDLFTRDELNLKLRLIQAPGTKSQCATNELC